MIIAVEDTSYRCKNCDSFGQCEYYNHRRPDSHICKEFRNDWRQRDVLDKISAEIEEKMSHYDHFENSNTANGLRIAREIVEGYKKGGAE